MPYLRRRPALVSVNRSSVVIDACPRCRGIWLDRGELDKLIALESRAYDSDDFLAEVQGRGAEDRERDDRHGSKKGKRRCGSFLGEFLDFG